MELSFPTRRRRRSGPTHRRPPGRLPARCARESACPRAQVRMQCGVARSLSRRGRAALPRRSRAPGSRAPVEKLRASRPCGGRSQIDGTHRRTALARWSRARAPQQVSASPEPPMSLPGRVRRPCRLESPAGARAPRNGLARAPARGADSVVRLMSLPRSPPTNLLMVNSDRQAITVSRSSEHFTFDPNSAVDSSSCLSEKMSWTYC